MTYEEAVLNGMVAYSASKKFAEKAAWEFVLREKPNFTLTTIHPVVVFGPQVIDEFAKGDLNLSNSFISDLLKLKGGDTVPEFGASSIDVRDVAKAHLVAFEKDDSAGKRLIVSNELFTNQTLLDIINKDVPKLKGKVVKGVPGSQPIPKSNIDDKKSREFLGIKYISLRDSVVNTLDQYTKVNGL